jgi:hypothetical protein
MRHFRRISRTRTLQAQTSPRVPPIDRFTIGHGMVGFLLGLWGVPWWVALTSSVTFEIVENFILKPYVPQIFPVGIPDTFANSAFDVTAWMGGWAVARGAFPAPHERAPIWH